MVPTIIKPFVDWTIAILDSAEGGTFVPPSGAVMGFQTTMQPMWSNRDADVFRPGHFEPSMAGLKALIEEQVESEMEAPPIEASIFAKKMVHLVEELESYECWIECPLEPFEMSSLHSIMHGVLGQLAERNRFEIDLEKWSPEDKLTADRILLALAYILAWQPYSKAVQFVWSLAKPWYMRLSEVVAQHTNNEDLSYLEKSLVCLRDRVYHFDALLYSYLEGAGSLEANEDVQASDDVDAEKMYRGRYRERDDENDDENF